MNQSCMLQPGVGTSFTHAFRVCNQHNNHTPMPAAYAVWQAAVCHASWVLGNFLHDDLVLFVQHTAAVTHHLQQSNGGWGRHGKGSAFMLELLPRRFWRSDKQPRVTMLERMSSTNCLPARPAPHGTCLQECIHCLLRVAGHVMTVTAGGDQADMHTVNLPSAAVFFACQCANCILATIAPPACVQCTSTVR